MGVITTGEEFNSGDQVTSTKLNDIANQATFTSAAATTDDSTLTVTLSGKLKVADDGIGSTQLLSDASIDSNRAVQTNHIWDDAVTQAKIADDAVGNDQLDDTTVSIGTYTNATVQVNQQGRVLTASSGAAYAPGMAYSGSTYSVNATTTFASLALGGVVGANRAFVLLMVTGGTHTTQFFIRPPDESALHPGATVNWGNGASGVYLLGTANQGGLVAAITNDAGAIEHWAAIASTSINIKLLCWQAL
jgi:hypothetical protein